MTGLATLGAARVREIKARTGTEATMSMPAESTAGLIDEFGVDLTQPLFPQIDALGDD